MQYKIVESAEDPKDSVVEKTGHVIKFTMHEVETDIKALEKLQKELQGKFDLEHAKMVNIEENHPFVVGLSEQDRFTVHMYQESSAFVNQLGKKIEEVAQALSEYRDVELPEIEAQTGLALDKEPKAVPEDVVVSLTSDDAVADIPVDVAPLEEPVVEPVTDVVNEEATQ